MEKKPDVYFNFNACNIDQKLIENRNRSRPFYSIIDCKSDSRNLRVVADKGTEFSLSLPNQVTSNAHRGLGMRIISVLDENEKDKIVINPVSAAGPLQFNLDDDFTKKFFSFDIKFSDDYEIPKAWLVHMQVWQCCGGVPPFAIHVAHGGPKNGPINLQFFVNDDNFEHHHSGPDNGELIYSMLVTRGEWNKITLELEPGQDGAYHHSGVAMWVNGVNRFTWSGHWGFKPTQSLDDKNYERRPNMGIDVGIYRRRQTSMQTIFVDNIQFGRTLNSIK